MPQLKTPYIGRFAPSPSGNLHFGSLVTALASFLQAKTSQGQWLLRLDDLDTPRNVPQADTAIQDCLMSHGLVWDELYRQSEHLTSYQNALQCLELSGFVFVCYCSRKQVQAAGGNYPGTCRKKGLSGSDGAIRFRNDASNGKLQDSLLGSVNSQDNIVRDDFILRRRDGIFGYHLASVTDDINMGVTEIVRGADLLLPSMCQIQLFNALQARIPDMLHLPVASFQDGRKLSKQNHALELDSQKASENLYRALSYLGQKPPEILLRSSVDIVISWAIENWQMTAIPAKTKIII